MSFLNQLSPELQVAAVAFVGAMVGALATIVGQIGAASVTARLAERRQRRLDKPREDLLRHLLHNRPPGKKWRKMTTLRRAIGASEEETARLLVNIKARGSLDDDNVWGLISVVGLPIYDDPEQDR